MHMLGRKDLNFDELENVRVSRSPTTASTANGEVQTNEEVTVFAHDLELVVTVQILEDTPAVLSPGKLCEHHGYSHEWASCQKPTSKPKWHKNPMQHGKLCTDCCPRFIARFFQIECKYVFYIVTAGHT